MKPLNSNIDKIYEDILAYITDMDYKQNLPAYEIYNNFKFQKYLIKKLNEVYKLKTSIKYKKS